MTRIAHYLGWLRYWFRMGENGWDYEQTKASRLFAQQQMLQQAEAMKEVQQARAELHMGNMAAKGRMS